MNNFKLSSAKIVIWAYTKSVTSSSTKIFGIQNGLIFLFTKAKFPSIHYVSASSNNDVLYCIAFLSTLPVTDLEVKVFIKQLEFQGPTGLEF